MDIGVRLRLSNPGAFGESEEEKKWGHRVRAGQNEPKLSKFSKMLRPLGENSSRFEEKNGFRCKKFQKLGFIWRQNVHFLKKMGLWVTAHNFMTNMGSLGACDF